VPITCAHRSRGVPCDAAICADRWLRGVNELPVLQCAKILFECSNCYADEWRPESRRYWYVPRAVRNQVYVVFADTSKEQRAENKLGARAQCGQRPGWHGDQGGGRRGRPLAHRLAHSVRRLMVLSVISSFLQVKHGIAIERGLQCSFNPAGNRLSNGSLSISRMHPLDPKRAGGRGQVHRRFPAVR